MDKLVSLQEPQVSDKRARNPCLSYGKLVWREGAVYICTGIETKRRSRLRDTNWAIA